VIVEAYSLVLGLCYAAVALAEGHRVAAALFVAMTAAVVWASRIYDQRRFDRG